MTIKGTYSFHFRQPALFSIERENLREQLYWSKRHKLITTQGDSVGFPQSAQPVANLSLISKTGFVSVMRLLSFELIERAIQLLLGCQHDAESFLSAEHSVVGEIADDLAQAYAALGDWKKSASHLQKSLRVVEVRHGPSSVEMGHELFKLAQIFFNG